MKSQQSATTRQVAGVLCAGALLAATPARRGDPVPVAISLTEWTVKLSAVTVPAGPVTFTVTNGGSIPHALEVEGGGIEQQTPLIQPGTSATLTLTLKPGTYEVYCPVGMDSHKKLGMDTHLKVVGVAGATGVSTYAKTTGSEPAAMRDHGDMAGHDGMAAPEAKAGPVEPIRVTGGGPVIQILPGPFPFPDSAGPILQSFGVEHEALESQALNGPYSNNVAPIAGTFRFSAWDLGSVRDSVDGVAEFTTQDGGRWKVVLDRVQTKDVPHHPKFGGVIRGLYYHGNTGVHTPLVPTINSAVALWSIAHLYKNGALVTDDAYVHVMLLSRTRRDGDWALQCWDCSKNKIEELQLQITPAPGEAKIDAPGGFLFVNWERSGVDGDGKR
jgi:plastocyanin